MRTEATQITSKFATLQKRDFLKGLLIAILTPVVGLLYQVISNWLSTDDAQFIINWKELARVAFYAFAAYIGKNFFEPTQTVIVVKPPLTSEGGEKDVMVNSNQSTATDAS